MTTRNSDIDLRPSEKGLLSVINFTVTKSGLEGKLLSIIINYEQPELEQQKSQLLQKEDSLKIQLSDLEKNLLEQLANSTGNILENIDLINNLNETKVSSNQIKDSLKKSGELQLSLDQQRNVYRSLAQKGALLYILISDLQKANNMYRFSLALFLKIFYKALDNQLQSNNIQQKLEYASTNLNRLLISNIGLSLFKKDRMMFALHIVHGSRNDLFELNEWDFFLGNIASQDQHQQMPSWLASDRQEHFDSFAQTFPVLIQKLQLKNADWNNWQVSHECEKMFPSQIKMNLSSFQRVLAVQVFRPDRIESAINNFVCESLAIQSVSGIQLSFENLYKDESTSDTPILFITTQGSDPSKELEEFAQTILDRDHFHQLSMGGNQNETALQMLREAAQKGHWLCFKNIHLVNSWLPILEKELKCLNLHKNFRLWLTTEPHISFPAILLETCLKVTYEAPPGIKKNIQRIYQNWPQTYIEKGNVQRAQLLFLLAWFHALIQERRIYIPQGWSKFYEFSYGDLKAGATIIENILQDGEINWETLYGLFENAIYGGRIDNDFDLRILRAYLESLFNDSILQAEKKLSIGQFIPQTKNIKDYMVFINKLLENDAPSIFGLPINIEKAVQRYNSTQIIDQLKVLIRINTINFKFDKTKWTEMLQPLLSMWKTLSKQFSANDKGQLIQQRMLDSEDPLESFLSSEALHGFQLYEKISNQIKGISEVLFGSGLLNSEIQQLVQQILSGDVPIQWRNFWEGPDNINNWLKGFIKRANAQKKWLQLLIQKQLLNGELEIAELFRPEIFLNVLRQKTSRKISTPIDDMKLSCSFEPDKLDSQMLIKIKGFLLQGAGFDGVRLTDPPQNLPEFSVLPVCYLAWVSQIEQDPYPPQQSGEIPVFYSQEREKLLCRLKINNMGIFNERIMAGVAIILTENY